MLKPEKMESKLVIIHHVEMANLCLKIALKYNKKRLVGEAGDD